MHARSHMYKIENRVFIVEVRSHGVAWGSKCHPWATECHLLATPENFLAIFYCCFVFVAAKERYPKILVEINLGICKGVIIFNTGYRGG